LPSLVSCTLYAIAICTMATIPCNSLARGGSYLLNNLVFVDEAIRKCIVG